MSEAAYVYGWPIGHSISPAIHNAAFRVCGLDVEYAARAVAPDQLKSAVEDLRAERVLGANITVPHKEAVLELADDLDEPARAIGAANTLYKRAGRLRATNTDGEGFGRSVTEAGARIEGSSVLLLGAGGSARAVAFAVARRGAGRLLIANRTLARAERLAEDLGRRFPRVRIQATPLDQVEPGRAAECDLIVNTTTVGMHDDAAPIAPLLPRHGATLVVDIIYNPGRTRLLREAEAAGARTLNGLPMLVYQAAAAWEIWMGRPAPVESMFEAANRALGEIRRATTP